jgi:apolipoprotein N-acyltransferase
MFGGLALWASFPPLAWWPLAWVAPVPWLLLIRWRRLPGRRPYMVVGLACFLHWLVLLQGIRLAHPALYLGWFALSAYLTVYPMLFIALSRVAVHRLRVSVVLAAPLVWTGLEFARGYLVTGFSMALLGHTQVTWTTVIQIADAFGAYGVSFVVICVAAGVARMLPLWQPGSSEDRQGWTLWPALFSISIGAATLLYGFYRQTELDRTEPSNERLRLALVQASFDTIFEADPKREDAIFQRYMELSEQAVSEHPDVDLLVWPESAFTGTLGEVLVDGQLALPQGVPLSQDEFNRRATAYTEAFRDKTRAVAEHLNQRAASAGAAQHNGVHMVVGTDTQLLGSEKPRRYNSALLIAPDGRVVDRYFKVHRVMFGEYVPLADTFPWIYRFVPLTHGLTPGDGPRVFEIVGVRLAPSICFESTVPHLIRRQIVALRNSGTPVDAVVSVTNDGWFWGSSILDLHLACAVFRAAEHRIPVVIAANTGFSAHIDSTGSILNQGPRRDEDIIYAEVGTTDAVTWYQTVGDLPALMCLLFCLAVAVIGLAGRRSESLRDKRLE